MHRGVERVGRFWRSRYHPTRQPFAHGEDVEGVGVTGTERQHGGGRVAADLEHLDGLDPGPQLAGRVVRRAGEVDVALVAQVIMG